MMESTKMLWFSQRRKLEKLFVEWAEEHGAAPTPMTMVGWLMLNNLLDVDAALALLNKDVQA
jgi:hypothetical protein